MHRHVEVYLDESGDLGFSEASSRHFVVVAMATNRPVELQRLVRRVRKRRGSCSRVSAELKFNSSPDRVRTSMCEGISESGAVIAWCAATKSNVPAAMRTDKRMFYLGMCANVLTDLSKQIVADSAHVILDKCSGNRSVMVGLEGTVVRALHVHHAGHFPPRVSVSHLDSQRSEGLQVADFVAGSIFRSLERSDNTYRDLVELRVTSGRMCW